MINFFLFIFPKIFFTFIYIKSFINNKIKEVKLNSDIEIFFDKNGEEDKDPSAHSFL